MKNLIREIHRRSLWQVLGIYLGASWIVLQIVDTMAGALGLPDWSASFALFLLVIGLPIVLATAFVQEGMTGRVERAATVDEPTPPPEGSAADAGTAPLDGTAARRSNWLTWRNALLGGVGAFALLGLLTAAYLFMRTSGIGPAATLVAQGVFEEGAEVILADFESADAELADVVTGALRIDLLQSPTIRVLERADLSADLQRMELDVDAPITAGVARELAARSGYAAVIEGEIGTVGSGYVLTASIVSGADGSSLAAFRATARGDDDLIDAIESLSRDIRDKSGESLRTVQSGPGLEQVTTGSLEALRLYTRGEAIETGGDFAGSVEFYDRAIAADPDFAMAHRKLGVVLGNLAIRQTDRAAALTRAFELRDRLPEIERYHAEAYYYELLLGDHSAAIQAYDRVLQVDPNNDVALNNLAVIYRILARYEEAEALYERALETNAPFQQAFGGLARARFEMGEYEAGLAALDLGVQALPSAAWLFEWLRAEHALGLADLERAESLLAGYTERFREPNANVRAAQSRYKMDASRGRLTAAADALENVSAVTWAGAHPVNLAVSRAWLAVARGDSAGAAALILRAHAEASESFAPADRVYQGTLRALLRIGAGAQGEKIQEEWLREVPEVELGRAGRWARDEMAARWALFRGDPAESIRLWTTYEASCPGPCAVRAALGQARAYEAAGDVQNAVMQYERFLTTYRLLRGFDDSAERPAVLERLGQLYDAEGDATNAVRYYAEFAALWSGADEELQPRVRAALARVGELQGAAE